MVSEIVSECVDYGIVTQLQLHVVLDRIHSRYLAPKRSLLQIMRTAGYRSGQFRCRTHTCTDASLHRRLIFDSFASGRKGMILSEVCLLQIYSTNRKYGGARGICRLD